MTDTDLNRQGPLRATGRGASDVSPGPRRIGRRQFAAGVAGLAATLGLAAHAPSGIARAANAIAATQSNASGALLPANRILTYYCFPGNQYMGILGEYDPDQLLAKLQDQAAGYEAADPTRPVKLAFEVIASVAQRDPQADGSYITDTAVDILNQYADFAEQNDLLILFDVQFGMRTVQKEVKGLEPWLKKPFVHLALDPEFKVQPGEVPGVELGQIDASDITWTQHWLADLSAKYNIPPKILLVHQFNYTEIVNKDTLAAVDGVQFVMDSDGFGTPQEKQDTYKVIVEQKPIQYNGVKLFYQQDDPLMTPAEILQLNPVPDVIIYQ